MRAGTGSGNRTESIEGRFRQVRPQNRLQRHFRNNYGHARATAKETEEADAAGDCHRERAGSVGGVRRWHLAWILLLSAVEVEEAECLQREQGRKLRGA